MVNFTISFLFQVFAVFGGFFTMTWLMDSDKSANRPRTSDFYYSQDCTNRNILVPRDPIVRNGDEGRG